MAEHIVTFPDGQRFKVTAPDGATSEEIIKFAQDQFKTAQVPQEQKPAMSDFEARVRSSFPARVAQGMVDPINAGAQLLSRVPGAEAINAATGYVNKLPVIGPITTALGMTPATPQQIDTGITENERRYTEARQATGDQGTDWARLAGNALSPANAAIAARLPSAATTIGRVVVGALGGGAAGLMTPVEDVEKTGFAIPKAVQTGVGSVAGAVIAPIMSKVIDAAGRFVYRRLGNPEVMGARAALETDTVMEQALREVGATKNDIPQPAYDAIKQQVLDSLKTGKQLDAAALLRSKDFEALGVQPTLGQVTRDPAQFAKERNLRGVAGIGDPLMERFNTQAGQLSEAVRGYGGPQASEAPQAGRVISGALSKADEQMRSRVSTAYDVARQSAGREEPIKLQGLAQDYERIVRDFGEENLPGAIRRRLEDYGVSGGKQTKLFTMQDGETLIQQINANFDPMKKAEAAALNQLRNSVKQAITETDSGGGPFAVAREVAKKRFQLQDAVPALRDAADGTTAPDDFVKRYVLGGKVDEVKKLADILSPEAKLEAKNQIGKELMRAAYGADAAGDAALTPKRLEDVIRKIGNEKLSAFYSPDEISNLHALSRVGAYINAIPANSAVNTSNSASAFGNLIGHIPGVPASLRAVSSLAQLARRGADVNRAINAEVPVGKPNLPPEMEATLAKLMGLTGPMAGAASAASLRQ